MRLLFFIHSLSGGGAERVTSNLANYWAGKGWDITIVTLATETQDFYSLHKTIRRISLNMAGDSRNPMVALVRNLRRIAALRRVLARLRPDAAIGMMTTANVLLALANRGTKVQVCIGVEQIYPPAHRLNWIWEILRRHCYCLLSAVTGLTRESAEWLRSNTNSRQVRVIPSPVLWPLPDGVPALEPQEVVSPEMRIILAVGRLELQKGFDLLIDAFAQLAVAFPQWRILILGEGRERQNLERQIELLDLRDKVMLPGRVGNVAEWYRYSDIFVLSSRFEGFPNALIEAMSHGLPAVSFDCDTGPRDIIRHEVDGLLVPNGDTLSMSRALARLINNTEMRAQLSSHAVEVRHRFSLTQVASDWEELMRTTKKSKTA